MKLLVFGSLNIDHVYHLPHFVREGETISSTQYSRTEGGKGFNQAVALAKAGQAVYFAGAIGRDGRFLQEYLEQMAIQTDNLHVLNIPTGHAVIQIDAQGKNSIILFGGANQAITLEMIDEVLSHFSKDDYLLMQNEISNGDTLLRRAADRGMRVVLNPSPVSNELLSWPLELVDTFILNEIEGADITGEIAAESIINELLRRFPSAHIVLTLGKDGAYYADASKKVYQPIIPTAAIDTTAAGDTFTGYYLRGIIEGHSEAEALCMAAHASSITVSRYGAGQAIPYLTEVLASRQMNHKTDTTRTN